MSPGSPPLEVILTLKTSGLFHRAQAINTLTTHTQPTHQVTLMGKMRHLYLMGKSQSSPLPKVIWSPHHFTASLFLALSVSSPERHGPP